MKGVKIVKTFTHSVNMALHFIVHLALFSSKFWHNTMVYADIQLTWTYDLYSHSVSIIFVKSQAHGGEKRHSHL